MNHELGPTNLTDALNDDAPKRHSRMSRSVSNLKKLGATNITLHAVQTRIVLLNRLWEKFETQHELIQAHLKEAFESE